MGKGREQGQRAGQEMINTDCPLPHCTFTPFVIWFSMVPYALCPVPSVDPSAQSFSKPVGAAMMRKRFTRPFMQCTKQVRVEAAP